MAGSVTIMRRGGWGCAHSKGEGEEGGWWCDHSEGEGGLGCDRNKGGRVAEGVTIVRGVGGWRCDHSEERKVAGGV